MECWGAHASEYRQLKPLSSSDPRFINIILTVAVPQSIPSIEESYKVM